MLQLKKVEVDFSEISRRNFLRILLKLFFHSSFHKMVQIISWRIVKVLHNFNVAKYMLCQEKFCLNFKKIEVYISEISRRNFVQILLNFFYSCFHKMVEIISCRTVKVFHDFNVNTCFVRKKNSASKLKICVFFCFWRLLWCQYWHRYYYHFRHWYWYHCHLM